MYKQIIKIPFICALFAAFYLFSSQAMARSLPEFADLVRENGPAVVNISTSKKVSPKQMIPEKYRKGVPPGSEELFDDLMKRFFGGEDGATPFDFDTNARGSGFILSADGYVVTNHHVVNGADEVLVKLNDRSEYKAKVVGSDKRSDVALLKIEATGLPTLKIGDSEKIEVGEWVLAIGSPFGFESSATSGIVSATGRNLPSDSYVPFIQTDVAINPGNSGGPLFNLDGEVIGINSQIYSRSGGFMGVSFAIPVNMAMDVIGQLKSGGSVKRGWIGVYIQEVDQDLAKSFGMSRPSGALVAQVMADGPSEGTLQAGDVILEFNGRKVASAAVLPSIVGVANAGQKVPLVIMRAKKRINIDLVIGELPGEEELSGLKPTQKAAPVVTSNSALGMDFADIDEMTRDEMSLGSGGVLVESVNGNPARRAGIQTGDVITMIDNRQVKSAAQFGKLASDLPKGETVAMLIHRDGSARFLALKLD